MAQSPKRSVREHLTRHACNICRTRRAKCDGNRPCGRCRNNGTECHYTEKRRESKESLRQEARQLREQISARESVLQALASSSNPQQIIEKLRNGEQVESVCRYIAASQSETNAKYDFTGNGSGCSIEQGYTERLGLGKSQESVSRITCPPSLATSDGASSPDTVLSPNPTWPNPFTPTSDDSETPIIIKTTEEPSNLRTSQKVAFELPASQPIPQLVRWDWLSGPQNAPDGSLAFSSQPHLLSLYHTSCMEQILKQQHQLLDDVM